MSSEISSNNEFLRLGKQEICFILEEFQTQIGIVF